MEERGLKISAKELEQMEDIIHQVMMLLPDLGFRTSHARFPYSLHHEFYRSRLRLHGKRLRHEEIAILLNRWAVEQEKPADAYVWQAITGAIRNLQAKNSISMPDLIQSGIENVAQGQQFETWARSFLKQIEKEST